jgi:Ni,Fe-hydrogenase maturation factor
MSTHGILPEPDPLDYTVEEFPPHGKSNGKGVEPAPSYVPPPWPTMDPAAYHGFAGEVVSTILPHTEADPVALLLQFLVSFGNAVGRGWYYQAEQTKHYGNLFAVLVGDTSKARKGTSADRVHPIFAAADPLWFADCVKSGMSSGEGVIFHVRDEVYTMRRGQLELVDLGVTDKRLLLQEHEFFQVLAVMKREGNILSRVIRDAWDGRERLQTLTKNSPTKATNACISIVGHITVEELRRMLDETAMANGFANRFLFACVKRSKLLPFGGALSPETITRLGEVTKTAISAAHRTDAITMSEPARALWRKVYPALSSGGEGLLAHITSRAEAQTVRLALIYALLDQAEAIDVVHLEAALAVWKYCEASARYVFGDVLGDPVADLILQTLRRDANGMSRNDILQLFSNHLPADVVGRALGQLLRAGKVRREVHKTSGRPREMWFAI